ncbi:HORMA domain, partial [Rhizoctonia solani]
MDQYKSKSKAAVDHSGERGLTFNQTVRELIEFCASCALLGFDFADLAYIVEVAIHTILFIRGVYPPDLFVRRRKWDAPVYQSRHPALNEYIAGAVAAVRDELLLGTVDKMVMVIKSGQDIALERYIFSLQTVVQPGPSEMSRWNKDMSSKFVAVSRVAPAFSFVSGKVNPGFPFSLTLIAEDMSFGIFLELQDGVSPSACTGSDPPPWIAAYPQHTSAGTSDDAELRVIRALETGLALVVQESGEKLSRISKAAGKKALK